MIRTGSISLILMVFLLPIVNACAAAEPHIPLQEQQAISFKQPLLQFKTPRHLDFCGDPVPLERRDVWERLDKQFLLALSREAQIILWIKRSRQYLPFIEAALRKRGLPDDLKYMAVAESDLNNHALSPKGAAGTWQFMKDTGIRFGLDRQEWTDQRYSFEKATAAAIAYLTTLHEQFGDWMLAVAAYNCGEERMARAIEEQDTEQFVDLSLPRETEEYLFRIMAIKIILSNPQLYGFMLEDNELYLPYDSTGVEVNLPGPLHLRAIAEAAKTTFRMIKELNPELRGYYLPAGKHRLFIPRDGAEGFTERLAASIARTDAGMKSIYIVRKGDTLNAIAAKLGLPAERLMQWNGITSSDIVCVGQKLVYYRAYGKQ
jgi:soluble lytic murein transglycosylase-like protein